MCSGHEFPRGVAARTMLACSSAALDEAVVEVNVPAVTAIHYRGTVEVLASRR